MTGKLLKGLMVIFLLFSLCDPTSAYAQKKKFDLKKGKSLLNKVKKVTKPGDPKNNSTNLPSTENLEESYNKRKLDPPDVKEQISQAQQAYANQSYSETRFYIKEAIKGIELEIGHNILSEMPEEVLGASFEESQDIVFSTGVGFAGFEVSRTYYGPDGQIQAAVINSAILNSTANFALYEGSYSNQDENVKVILYKGQKSVVEADDYSGYKISHPFGQSSLFVLACELCQSEDELISTADQFDLDMFKSLLGEK